MMGQVEISDAARQLCAQLFPLGASSQVVSNPPHPVIGKHAVALDQLVRAKVVRLHRDGLTFTYSGTLWAGQIARAVAAEAGR